MLCSTSTTVDAALARGADAVEQAVDLGGIQAGGRLVDQQQLRLGRKRAREFQHALLAVGERAREHVAPRRQPDEGQQLHRLGAAARMVAPKRAPWTRYCQAGMS